MKIVGGITYGSDKGVTIPPKTTVDAKIIDSKSTDYIEIALVDNEKEIEK